MNRFTAPLKFVAGWAIYFLTFWAVYPLAAGAVLVLSDELFSGLLTALLAFGVLAYLLACRFLRSVAVLEEFLQTRPGDKPASADSEKDG